MLEEASAASNSWSVARLYCLLTRSTAASISSSAAETLISLARSSSSFSLIKSWRTSRLIAVASVDAPGACEAAEIRLWNSELVISRSLTRTMIFSTISAPAAIPAPAKTNAERRIRPFFMRGSITPRL